MVGMNDHNIKSRLQNINNATNVWVTDSLKKSIILKPTEDKLNQKSAQPTTKYPTYTTADTRVSQCIKKKDKQDQVALLAP